MGLVAVCLVLTERLDNNDALIGGKMGLFMASRVRDVLATKNKQEGSVSGVSWPDRAPFI